MRIFTWAAGCAAVWFFVVACSNGTSTSTTTTGAGTNSAGSGGDAGTSIIDTYCQDIAVAFCEADYICCTVPQGRLSGGGVDDATGLKNCKQAVLRGVQPLFCSLAQDRDFIEASLQAGTTVFDQAQFDLCIAQFKSMLAGGAACAEPPEHVFNTTCLSSFRGQGMPGDACPFPGELWQAYWEESALPCKAGRCENGACVPFLKTGDACRLDGNPGMTSSMICNFPNKEVCWGAPGAGGTGSSGGDAGIAEVMGTCRPEAELGEACDPGNDHECKSLYCDATGKCVLPDPQGSACDDY